MQTVFSFSAQLCEDVTAELMPLPVIIYVGDLEQDSRVEKCFYLRAHRVGNRNIAVKVGQLDLALDCSELEASVLACRFCHERAFMCIKKET
jgi:hypothetical protein